MSDENKKNADLSEKKKEKKDPIMKGKKKKKTKKVSVFQRSIGARLTATIVICLAASLVLIGICNFFMLPSFYRGQKIKRLKSVYEALNTDEDHTDISDDIHETLIREDIDLTITDSGLEVLYPSEAESGEDDRSHKRTRLFGYISSFFYDKSDEDDKKPNATILIDEDTYKVQVTEDDRIHINNLEMWGSFDNGDKFLLQTPMEGISVAVRMSSVFYVLIGMVVMVVAALVCSFLIRRFTRPIKELTSLSKKMADLDFDARYTGETTDEIGQLGTSFNKMSDELEKNISELKTANTQLMKDNEEKTRIDEMRRDFLNNVTHELKTPIALIQGYAEGLKDNIAGDEESRDFYADVIIDEASKMNSMVQQLLTLNRLEFGNDTVEMERFDLTQLVAGVIKGMGVMIREKGATVSFDDTKPAWVWGDEFKIEEVVTNYLSNACHHVEGEKRIEVKMEKRPDGTIRTTVFNTGLPIPEDSIDHVFEKFYKVDKARTRAYGGSGIGLSIVKAIMDGHHKAYGVNN